MSGEVKGGQTHKCKVRRPVCVFMLPMHVFATAYRVDCLLI